MAFERLEFIQKITGIRYTPLLMRLNLNPVTRECPDIAPKPNLIETEHALIEEKEITHEQRRTARTI